MDDLERRTTDMVLSVGRFGTENADLYKNNALAVEKFAQVQTFIGQLTEKGEIRSSAGAMKFSQTARRKMTRGELKATLANLAETARDIRKNNSNFDNVFVIPRQNLNDAALLETGRAFHRDATPDAVKNLFLGYGEDENFLEELEAQTEAFADAIGDQDAAKRERIGANASIDEMLVEVLKAIGTLKVIMPKILKNDAGKLADWLNACKIQKAPQSSATNQPPTP